MRLRTVGLLAAAVAGILSSQVKADSIDPNSLAVEDVNGVVSISMKITGGSQFKTGDSFSFFDVPSLDIGYVATAPSGWTASYQLYSGTTYGVFAALDNSTKYNVKYEYVASSPSPVLGLGVIGTFTFKVTPPITVDTPIVGAATYENILNNGDRVDSVNLIETSIDVNPVPVPAAAWMGMSTLLGIGTLGFFRKRARV